MKTSFYFDFRQRVEAQARPFLRGPSGRLSIAGADRATSVADVLEYKYHSTWISGCSQALAGLMKARALVGRNIRRLRVAKGITQEALGLAAGCEPSYVGRLERGGENPTVELLEAIAKALGDPLAAFFDRAGSRGPLKPGLPAGRKPGAVRAARRRPADKP